MSQVVHEGFLHGSGPELVPHPRHAQFMTCRCLEPWRAGEITAALPCMVVTIHGFDLLCRPGDDPAAAPPLRFQQKSYRLWYQIDGTGIFQNATTGAFGAARPGLLGVMESGERYSYLHRTGPLECFLASFSLTPSRGAQCYWNSSVEGRCFLDTREHETLRDLVSGLIRTIDRGDRYLGLSAAPRLLDIMVTLFRKGLLRVDESRFPRNKPKSLVSKAIAFMKSNYRVLRHQEALEHECGVDINYLNILFKREKGMTLYQYLTDLRMEHAKHFLAEGRLSVADIAARIGYPNGNSFTRVFGRREGVSPREYRRRLVRSGQAPRLEVA